MKIAEFCPLKVYPNTLNSTSIRDVRSYLRVLSANSDTEPAYRRTSVLNSLTKKERCFLLTAGDNALYDVHKYQRLRPACASNQTFHPWGCAVRAEFWLFEYATIFSFYLTKRRHRKRVCLCMCVPAYMRAYVRAYVRVY